MVIAVVFLYVARCSGWLLQLCFCMLPGVLMVNAVVFLPVAKCSAWLMQLYVFLYVARRSA